MRKYIFLLFILNLKVVFSIVLTNWQNQIKIRSLSTGIEAINMNINDLAGIDKLDALFIKEVTFIDLSNNQLESIVLLENFTIINYLNLKKTD